MTKPQTINPKASLLSSNPPISSIGHVHLPFGIHFDVEHHEHPLGFAALTPSSPLQNKQRRWKTFQRFISAFGIPNCLTRTTCVSKFSVRVKVKRSSSNHSVLKLINALHAAQWARKCFSRATCGSQVG